MTAADLPGRLGDPDRSLATDHRADPRLQALFSGLGLATNGEPPPLGTDAGRDAVLEYVAAAEEGFEALFAGLVADLPPVTGVRRASSTVTTDEGNEITLYVHSPEGQTAALPAIYHIHGGGMVLLEAAGPVYARWRDSLAAAGLVVIGVEYRNGGGKLGPYPFPAGLNDCVAGLRHVLDQQEHLQISHVVISGESGGGNLTLATMLTAKRQGWADRISGVFAQCPYISGAYAKPPAALTSLTENNGYFLRTDMMALLVEAYDPGGANATEPTCWPLNASVDDLRGLPPHIISVNQLDPLRDEGLHYLRLLHEAGVPATGRIIPGTTHAADVMAPGAIPETYADTIRSISAFAYSLAT